MGVIETVKEIGASLILGDLLLDSFRYADRLRLRVLQLEESQSPLR